MLSLKCSASKLQPFDTMPLTNFKRQSHITHGQQYIVYQGLFEWIFLNLQKEEKVTPKFEHYLCLHSCGDSRDTSNRPHGDNGGKSPTVWCQLVSHRCYKVWTKVFPHQPALHPLMSPPSPSIYHSAPASPASAPESSAHQRHN